MRSREYLFSVAPRCWRTKCAARNRRGVVPAWAVPGQRWRTGGVERMAEQRARRPAMAAKAHSDSASNMSARKGLVFMTDSWILRARRSARSVRKRDITGGGLRQHCNASGWVMAQVRLRVAGGADRIRHFIHQRFMGG